MSFLEICHVEKSYGSTNVLKGVSLSVNEGEVICIIGPSGSGKSTLLRCVNNLEEIDAGRIYLRGEPVGLIEEGDHCIKLTGKAAARQRARFAMVFQSFQLFPHMTVLANLVLGPVNIKKEPRRDAERYAKELLSEVG